MSTFADDVRRGVSLIDSAKTSFSLGPRPVAESGCVMFRLHVLGVAEELPGGGELSPRDLLPMPTGSGGRLAWFEVLVDGEELTDPVTDVGENFVDVLDIRPVQVVFEGAKDLRVEPGSSVSQIRVPE